MVGQIGIIWRQRRRREKREGERLYILQELHLSVASVESVPFSVLYVLFFKKRLLLVWPTHRPVQVFHEQRLRLKDAGHRRARRRRRPHHLRVAGTTQQRACEAVHNEEEVNFARARCVSRCFSTYHKLSTYIIYTQKELLSFIVCDQLSPRPNV